MNKKQEIFSLDHIRMEKARLRQQMQISQNLMQESLSEAQTESKDIALKALAASGGAMALVTVLIARIAGSGGDHVTIHKHIDKQVKKEPSFMKSAWPIVLVLLQAGSNFFRQRMTGTSELADDAIFRDTEFVHPDDFLRRHPEYRRQ